ncbi:MAG: hypothetical protein M1393_02490 [Candidatus Thermoplasmatota archaeon]|nr:hypothetical protein [Candidatus Thermoplasmatota archaeon]MDA8143023.1 hypothetical protein [Thermoplasmatales archaeon]
MDRLRKLSLIHLIPFTAASISFILSMTEYYLLSNISFATYKYWMENISLPILAVAILAGIPRLYYLWKRMRGNRLE